jgi:hypothetical protein
VSVETRQSAILPRPRRRVVWLLALGSSGLAVLTAGVLLLIARPPSEPHTAPAELPVVEDVPQPAALRDAGEDHHSWLRADAGTR